MFCRLVGFLDCVCNSPEWGIKSLIDFCPNPSQAPFYHATRFLLFRLSTPGWRGQPTSSTVSSQKCLMTPSGSESASHWCHYRQTFTSVTFSSTHLRPHHFWGTLVFKLGFNLLQKHFFWIPHLQIPAKGGGVTLFHKFPSRKTICSRFPSGLACEQTTANALQCWSKPLITTTTKDKNS